MRGQANLLDDLRAAEDLERIRLLFDDLETQKDVIDLLARAEGGEGVRIFIGSENKLFSLSGSSMIAAPFRDGDAEDRRRARRDRPDAAQLRPHRADGRLHRPGGLAAARRRALSGRQRDRAQAARTVCRKSATSRDSCADCRERRGGRVEHLMGGRAGLRSEAAATPVMFVVILAVCPARRLADVAHDLLGRRALLLHRRRYRAW